MTKKELDRAKKAVALHTLLDNIYTDIAFLMRKDSAMGDVLVKAGTVGKVLASCDDAGFKEKYRAFVLEWLTSKEEEIRNKITRL